MAVCTVKLEALRFYEKSLSIYQSLRRNIPDVLELPQYCLRTSDLTTGYYWGGVVQDPGGAQTVFLQSTHPVSYSLSTGGPIPRSKAAGA